MYFGGLKALDGVSLTVTPGLVHGLIGPNGSGKSTLVNVVTGVYTPTGGVIPSEIARLSRVIRRVQDAGVTMLVIEHHMDLVMGVSNHVTALDYGKKIAEGTPAEIQANQRLIEAYLGSAEHSFEDLRRGRDAQAVAAP